MSEMIERVARALWHDRFPDVEWRDPAVSEKERDDYRGHARAAIEALREPTEAMLQASQRAIADTARRLGWSKAQRKERMAAQTKSVMRWAAMIDACLAEHQSPPGAA